MFFLLHYWLGFLWLGLGLELEATIGLGLELGPGVSRVRVTQGYTAKGGWSKYCGKTLETLANNILASWHTTYHKLSTSWQCTQSTPLLRAVCRTRNTNMLNVINSMLYFCFVSFVFVDILASVST